MAYDSEVWTYSLADVVMRGWGLAMRCSGCGHEARWTEKDLTERFVGRLDVQVASLRPALACSCGARSPRLYFYQSSGLDIGARAASARAAAAKAAARQTGSVLHQEE